jgi:quinolinate synthase
VDLADYSGSTEYIINTLRDAPAGSKWAIGTEVHLVNRMANEMKAKGVHVTMLSDCQCLCTTMYRIDEPHMLWILDGLCGIGTTKDAPIDQAGGPVKVRNVVSVHPQATELALLALNRMLEHTGGGAVKA